MAFLRPVIRSALDHTGDPVEALERTNSILVDERRTGLFVTVICGVLDLDTASFTFANAGHEMPLLAPAGGVEPRWVPGGGPLVGVFGRLDLAPRAVEIRPGERLVLYTDGLTDAAGARRRALRRGAAPETRSRESCAGHAEETTPGGDRWRCWLPGRRRPRRRPRACSSSDGCRAT